MGNTRMSPNQQVAGSILGEDTLELWVQRSDDPGTMRELRARKFLLFERVLRGLGVESAGGITASAVSMAASASALCHFPSLPCQLILCAAAMGKVTLDALPEGALPSIVAGNCEWLRGEFGDRATARFLLMYSGQATMDYGCNDPSLAWCRGAVQAFIKAAPRPLVDPNRHARMCMRLMAWLSSCHGVGSFDGILPSHLASFRMVAGKHEDCNRPISLLIGFLVGEGLLGSHFLAMRKPCRVRMPAGAGDFTKGDFPSGGIGPAQVYDSIPRALSAMAALGYSEGAMKTAMKGAEMFALFLAEHGLMASEEGALAWRSIVDRKAGRRLHLWTGAMVATLVAGGVEVTAVAIADRTARARSNLAIPIPGWAAGAVGSYGKWRSSMGMAPMVRGSIARLCAFLDGRGVRDFARLDRQALVDFYAQDRHATAYGKYCACRAIIGFLTYLAGEGAIRFSVAAAMPCPRVQSVRPVAVLSREQRAAVARFCASASGERGLRVRLALELGLLMGLRKSDACGLCVSGIDPVRMVIRLTQKKTGREAELPMPVPVLGAICDYLSSSRQRHGGETLMVSVNAPHAPIRKSPVTQLDIRRLGCDPFTMHDLRRTFATGLLEGGADFRMIASLLGHAGTGTVHRYLSASERLLRECCLPFDDLASEVI